MTGPAIGPPTPSAVIGLYGGSFDPVHRGHVEIARRARDQVPCDAVWFVPAARTPFKPTGAHADAEARVDLLERALAGEDRLAVSCVELDHPGRRSVATVRALAAAFPDVTWRWIMGEDSFDDLPRWADPEAFVQLAPPVVQPRPGSAGARPDRFLGMPVTWLEGEPMNISSTAIREALARGERPEELHPRVLERIEARALYREEGDA